MHLRSSAPCAAGYPAENEHVQLKTSKQLMKNDSVWCAWECPRTTTSACGRSLTAGRAPSSGETAIPKVFPDQEQHPYTFHAAGESTLSKGDRLREEFRAEGGELIDNLQCWRSANGRHDFNPDAVKGT